MSFGLQNFNNSGAFNGSISSVSGPTPIVNPVTVMPGLTGSIGSSNTVTGITNANTGNTGSITGSTNTGTINSGSGATQVSRAEVERAMLGASGQNATQTVATMPEQSLWDKYKVWAIPGAALVVILVAMFFFMRAKN